MAIKLLTFKTNQTVIGDLEIDNMNHSVTVKQPVQVVVQPTEKGPMMGFVPFVQFCEEFKTGMEFSKDDILCITTPLRDLVNEYSKHFGSGIEIVSSIPNV